MFVAFPHQKHSKSNHRLYCLISARPQNLKKVISPVPSLHPLSSLDLNEVEKLAAGKSECVVVCKSGNGARQAAEKLKASH
jgi:hypothetical protein